MAPQDIHRGSCRCGSVKYEVTGDPIGFYVCHCTNCKKSGGSAFNSNVFFKADQYKYTQGEDLTTIYVDTDTASGNPKKISFCSKCGSPIRLHNEAKQATGVPSGTFDDSIDDWVPTLEVFGHAKRKWVGEITSSAKPPPAS